MRAIGGSNGIVQHYFVKLLNDICSICNDTVKQQHVPLSSNTNNRHHTMSNVNHRDRENFTVAKIHDMIIRHTFRMLFEQWNYRYELEKGIVNIIKNYAGYEKEILFINNNYYFNFSKEFPSITKEYWPKGVNEKNGMISINPSQFVRFFDMDTSQFLKLRL